MFVIDWAGDGFAEGRDDGAATAADWVDHVVEFFVHFEVGGVVSFCYVLVAA